MTSGQTIAEKVLSRQNRAGKPVRAGDMIDAAVDGLLVINYGRIRAAFRRIGYPDGPPRVFDPDRVFLMNEHFQPPLSEAAARWNYESRRDAGRLGITNFHESEMGICHQMMLDNGYVRPGELVLGSDSHTVSYGALNVAATGIGNDETAYALSFGELYLSVPATIKVELRGSARPYPFGKDIILYLAGRYGDDFAQDKSLEFAGEGAAALDIASRLTIADHAVEVGAKFGLFLADHATEAYVRARTARPYTPLAPDPDAVYEKQITVDIDELDFQVARPFTFDNVCPVGEVTGIRIDQARIGSCANGRFEDIEIAARLLRGRHVAPGVRCYISPASMAVYQQCVDAGLVGDLLRAGVQFQNPGCTICQSPSIVLNEEVCITSTTRNYRGRFGGSTCAEAQIYLAGPAVVAASAITGRITDPREFLGG
jgi:3-isopropylmalate/(R)-2-methylmalate dehydratase large subunit